MVGGLVKNHQVGLFNQYGSQSHTLFLTSRQLLYRLVHILYLQFCEHLLCTVLVIPRLKAVHLLHQVLQLGVVIIGYCLFITCNDACLLAATLHACFNNCQVTVKIGLLLQVSHTQVIADRDFSALVRLFSGNHFQ